MSTTTHATPISAATVSVLIEIGKNIHTLLLCRNKAIRFYGGAWVFPGGKVELLDNQSSSEEENAKLAACRETHEESGLILHPENLLAFSHWTTPPGQSKRYSTWFFLAPIANQAVTIDGNEIHDYQWMQAKTALARHAASEIELAPATFVTLTWLAQFNTLDQIKDALPDEPTRYLPRTIVLDDGKISLYHGDAGYETADIHAPGARHRLDMRNKPYRYETYTAPAH